MRNVTSSLGKIIPTAIPSLLTAPLCLSQEQYCTKTGLCSSRSPCFDTYLAWLNNQVLTRSTCGAWRTAAASPKCRLARNKGSRSGLICLHSSNKQLEEKLTPMTAERCRRGPSLMCPGCPPWWWFAESLFEGPGRTVALSHLRFGLIGVIKGLPSIWVSEVLSGSSCSGRCSSRKRYSCGPAACSHPGVHTCSAPARTFSGSSPEHRNMELWWPSPSQPPMRLPL